jgi:clan AA aspartic protease (TIGR02281 family)
LKVTRITLIGGSILLVACLSASGAVYRWVDCDGQVHFTDQISHVPLTFRSQVDLGNPLPDSPCQQETQPAIASQQVLPFRHIVPFNLTHGVLFVDALINGTVHLPMLIDTGASHTIIPAGTARQLGLSWQISEYIPIRAVGQIFQAPLTQVASLAIGNATRHNVPVIVYGDGLDQPQTGILGMSFLRHFAFTIDVTTQRIVLTPLAVQP